MKKLISLIVLCLVFTAFSNAQDESVKIVVLNEVLELAAEKRDENANFQVVNIKRDGRIIHKFSVDAAIHPTLEGIFRGGEAEYVLYRSYMGQGGCAAGSLYIIKFHIEENPRHSEHIHRIGHIQVSPALTACMGDGPILFSLSFSGTRKEVFTLSAVGHTINLEQLDKWVEIKKPIIKKK